MANTVGEYLQAKTEGDLYIRKNYTLEIFFDAVRDNVISQVRTQFTQAINKKTVFPKIVLVPLEDDLLRDLDHDTFGISHILGNALKWLASEIHKMVLAHKEKLPPKAMKTGYPTILWAALPSHRNFDNNISRRKFNDCLEKVVDNFTDMRIIRMKKEWDHDDHTLFKMGRFSSTGLTAY